MYKEVENKIKEIIELFESNDSIKDMISLKKELLEDEKVSKLLNDYISNLDNPYSKECIRIKEDLLSNPKFKKYKDYEEKLLFILMQVNHKLKNLQVEKSCGL